MSSTGPAGGLGPSGGGGTGNMGGGQGNPSQLHGHFQYMKGAAEACDKNFQISTFFLPHIPRVNNGW